MNGPRKHAESVTYYLNFQLHAPLRLNHCYFVKMHKNKTRHFANCVLRLPDLRFWILLRGSTSGLEISTCEKTTFVNQRATTSIWHTNALKTF